MPRRESAPVPTIRAGELDVAFGRLVVAGEVTVPDVISLPNYFSGPAEHAVETDNFFGEDGLKVANTALAVIQTGRNKQLLELHQVVAGWLGLRRPASVESAAVAATTHEENGGAVEENYLQPVKVPLDRGAIDRYDLSRQRLPVFGLVAITHALDTKNWGPRHINESLMQRSRKRVGEESVWHGDRVPMLMWGETLRAAYSNYTDFAVRAPIAVGLTSAYIGDRRGSRVSKVAQPDIVLLGTKRARAASAVARKLIVHYGSIEAFQGASPDELALVHNDIVQLGSKILGVAMEDALQYVGRTKLAPRG